MTPRVVSVVTWQREAYNDECNGVAGVGRNPPPRLVALLEGCALSRIRQIKPSWFLDKELRRGTTADAREFYIGLWMLADDDGWLAWDEERIAAELYPFEPIRKREVRVAKWSDALERLNGGSPHLVVYDCGHAVVPKMAAHQRIAGTRTTSVHKRHIDICRHVRSRVSLQEATSSHGNSEGNSVVGKVGNSARAPEGGAESEFQSKVPRMVALGGGK